MFCTKCGNQVSDTARFCTKCGNVLSPLPNQNANPSVDEKPLEQTNAADEARKVAEEKLLESEKRVREAEEARVVAEAKAIESAKIVSEMKSAEEERLAKERAEEEARLAKEAEEAAKKKYSELEKALNNMQNRQKKCPHCGTLVLNNSQFCKNCGKSI